MKKILFLFALVLPLVFNSCSDDDDDDKASLNGTSWYYSEEGEERTLSFSTSTWTMDYSYAGDTDKWSGSYTYNPPTVILKEDGIEMKLTISGNKMTSEANEDGDIFVYTKK